MSRHQRVGALASALAACAAAALLISTPAPAATVPAVHIAPAQVAAVSAITTRAAGTITQTVRTVWAVKGDTLWRLSSHWCHNPWQWRSLAAASGIRDPRTLQIGQRVTIRCVSTSSTSTPPPATPAVPPPTVGNRRIGKVLAYALAQRGKWYRWGTAGPNTYDCSGLVMAAYARVGVRLNHQSHSMMRQGRAVSLRALHPGDVLYRWSRSGQGHVVLYIGGGKIIEAPHSGAQVRVRALRVGEWFGARRMIG